KLAYVVYPDGKSNLDSFFEESETPAPTDTSTTRIDLNSVTIHDATIRYIDLQGDISALFQDFDAVMDIQIADQMTMNMSSTLGGLSISSAGVSYLSELPLTLNQTMIVDTENERVTISEGSFLIRGLALNLSGMISDWSQENLLLDIQFASSSD